MKKISLSLLSCFIALSLQAQENQFALEFDGIDDYVEFHEDLVLPNTVTIEMWVNPYATYILDPTNGYGQYFIGKHSADGSQNILLIGYHTHYRNGTYYNTHDGLFVRVGGGGDTQFASGGHKIAGWHHLAVIIEEVDVDSSDITVYRNGELLWANGVSSVIGDNASNSPLELGMDWDNVTLMKTATDFFNGQIKEVRIWDHVRTQPQIQVNMNQSLIGNETGLIAYWNMNRGQGQAVIDQANAFDGRLGSTDDPDASDPAWSITEFPYNLEPEIIAYSDFEVNAEGWELADGGDGPYHGTGEGNPGGYILGREEGSAVWKFSAPEKFLGTITGAYGHSISFDMRQIYIDNQNDRTNDVILVRDSVSLSFNFRYNPPDTFSTYCAPILEGIIEGRGWINDTTGNTATKEELQYVLADLDELKIRGEFQVGEDEAWLDNVILYGIPAPEVDFTANVTAGNMPLEVQFTDNSTGDCSSWLWDFEDEETSIEQNPTHTYMHAGIYSVSLTVTGAGGTVTETKSNLITVYAVAEISGLTDDSQQKLLVIPNPVSDFCNIRLYLPETTDVQISVHSVNGNTLNRIYSGSLNAGYQNISWNFEGYRPGIYYIRMQSDNYTSIQKCIKID